MMQTPMMTGAMGAVQPGAGTMGYMPLQQQTMMQLQGGAVTEYVPRLPDSIASKLWNKANEKVKGKRDFTSLVMLLRSIKLPDRGGMSVLQLLDQPGANHTLFAPTDVAFAKTEKWLLAHQQQPLLRMDPNAMRATLLYHIVPQLVLSRSLVDDAKLPTLEGRSLCVFIWHNVIRINYAKVVKADIHASNGAIHEIDHVLVPMVDCLANKDLFLGKKKTMTKQDKYNMTMSMNSAGYDGGYSGGYNAGGGYNDGGYNGGYNAGGGYGNHHYGAYPGSVYNGGHDAGGYNNGGYNGGYDAGGYNGDYNGGYNAGGGYGNHHYGSGMSMQDGPKRKKKTAYDGVVDDYASKAMQAYSTAKGFVPGGGAGNAVMSNIDQYVGQAHQGLGQMSGMFSGNTPAAATGVAATGLPASVMQPTTAGAATPALGMLPKLFDGCFHDTTGMSRPSGYNGGYDSGVASKYDGGYDALDSQIQAEYAKAKRALARGAASKMDGGEYDGKKKKKKSAKRKSAGKKGKAKRRKT